MDDVQLVQVIQSVQHLAQHDLQPLGREQEVRTRAPRPSTIPASSDMSRISAPKYYPYPFKYHLHHVRRPIYLCFSYQYFNEILFFNIANILLTENSTSMDAYMPGHYAG